MSIKSIALREPAPSDWLANLPVAVIGAGPVGLAALARLIARGIQAIVLEAGEQVGANLLTYGHVRLFTPWQFNIDDAVAQLLQGTGWSAPAPCGIPFAADVVEQVLKPFARLPQVQSALRLRTRVTSISREGFDKLKSRDREKAPFVIHALQDGKPVTFRALAVLDASGTWNTPNPLGASGLAAKGEQEFASSISYGIPDVLGREMSRFAGKRTLVVGAGHSAANTLLALASLAESQPGGSIVWAVRSPVLTRVFGAGEADALPARGRLGMQLRALRDSGALEFVSGMRVNGLRKHADGKLVVEGFDSAGAPLEICGIDEIVCATGQRPNLQMTSELRVRVDPMLESTEALAPLIDPNVHSCGTVRPHGHRQLSHPERGFYTIGVKSYGRAPTFLMTTGYEQARSVVAALAGDLDVADRVELNLPETSVCGTTGAQGVSAASSQASCGTRKEVSTSSCASGTPKTNSGSGRACAAPATDVPVGQEHVDITQRRS